MMAKGLLPRGVVNPSGSWKSESAVANASGNGSRTPRCPEYDPPARRNKGGPSCTATTTPRHPFEPSSKRRRGFPLASLALSEAIASSGSTPNSSRNSAGTTCARAARAAAFPPLLPRNRPFRRRTGGLLRPRLTPRTRAIRFARRGLPPRRADALTCRRPDLRPRRTESGHVDRDLVVRNPVVPPAQRAAGRLFHDGLL